MGDWNEQGAANNNLKSTTIQPSKLIGQKGVQNHEFSEELFDGGEQDQVIKKQLKKRQPGMG